MIYIVIIYIISFVVLCKLNKNWLYNLPSKPKTELTIWDILCKIYIIPIYIIVSVAVCILNILHYKPFSCKVKKGEDVECTKLDISLKVLRDNKVFIGYAFFPNECLEFFEIVDADNTHNAKLALIRYLQTNYNIKDIAFYDIIDPNQHRDTIINLQ